MAVSILFELNQELTRLFAAGSRLAAGDPRIKKYLEPLQKYGEKAPVFLKLAALLEDLLNADANSSAQKLIETKAFLLSVISTQGEAAPDDGEVSAEIGEGEEGLSPTANSYRSLLPVIEALNEAGSGRMDIIKDAYKKGVFGDPRLALAAARALKDKNYELADYLESKVLPSIGEIAFPILLDDYDENGDSVDGRRLSAMHRICSERALPLAEKAVNEGSDTIKAYALRIMGAYPKYEETLLSMLDERKQVREEAMKALAMMDSKAGIDKMIGIYKSGKAGTVKEALSSGKGEYLAGELIEIVRGDYEGLLAALNGPPPASKDESDALAAKIQRVSDDISVLKYKNTDSVMDLLKTMLSDDSLSRADAASPREKKQGLKYKSLEENALEAIYLSGRGEDYILKMFDGMREGRLGNLFGAKKKPLSKEIRKPLAYYAFLVGARRFDADEFYKSFFQTGFYNDVADYDIFAFQKVFLDADNPPPYSAKIALWFFTKKKEDNFHLKLAAQTVSADDYGTLGLMVDYVATMLVKNNYSYAYYEVLKNLGEIKHRAFKDLYELLCSKGRGSVAERKYLAQYLL